MHVCKNCSKSFSQKHNLRRHEKSCLSAEKQEFKCEKCECTYSRKDSLKDHIKLKHQSSNYSSLPSTSAAAQKEHLTMQKNTQKREISPNTLNVCNKKVKKTIYKRCSICKEDIEENKWSQHQRKNSHKEKSQQVLKDNVSFINCAFSNRLKSFSINNVDESILDVKVLFEENLPIISALIESELVLLKSIKFNLELFCEFTKFVTNEGDNIIKDVKSMQTKMSVILDSDELATILSNMADDLKVKLEEFQEKDSGWSLIAFLRIEININKYQPLRASSYFELPKKIRDKKACINVQNLDEFCFKWAIISALKSRSRSKKLKLEKPSSYKIRDIAQDLIEVNGRVINFSGMRFPATVDNVKIFERNNPEISVNVFGYETHSSEDNVLITGPLYHTGEEKKEHINLLYCENIEEEESDGRTHYVFIKNISRFLRSQLTKKKGRMHLCNGCLQRFSKESELANHKSECRKVVTLMPKESEKYIKFNKYEKKFQVPFVVYADFECILPQISHCNRDPEKSYTLDVQLHEPCACSYFIKSSFDDKLDRHREFFGKDSPVEFVEKLRDDLLDLYKTVLMKRKPMKDLTQQENLDQQTSPKCFICEEKFNKDDERVRDHCHLTGAYRGPAHLACNLRCRVPKFFPILFHNFTGYDCHLLVKSLTEKIKGDISIIPLNKEKYISLSYRIHIDEKNSFEMRFLDSNRFLQASIESLAKNLLADDLKITKKIFQDDSSFELMIRKGILPYDYLDSWERFEECSLPPIDKFFNRMTNQPCSEEDYSHAEKVWDHFKCETLKDYLKLYLKSDVLLLTDIFENFRKICIRIYKLDPCHYYTSPGLSWDAMLKKTRITLELLTNMDMSDFFKKGIRGGLCQCSHRHAVSNNKYLSNYDSGKSSEYLMYLDANNLYGWAMSQPLPTGCFEWGKPEIYTKDYVLNLKDSDVGCVLEVDLDYPPCLHDIHNDLPFCCENVTTPGSKLPKLIANLSPKEKYVIHLTTLQQCIKNGLTLTKVHRVLTFNQSKWLDKYISLNTEERKKAKNKFEKDFFKLMNNSVYGKTMENVEKRRDVKIVTQWENQGRRIGCRSLISKPNFHSRSIFSPNMCAIEMKKVKIKLDKPIYLGFVVLELSKWLMYDFHYGYMKKKFDTSIRLNYMDTDSFIYSIVTEDFYADIYDDVIHPDKSRFDTSEYPKDNPHNFPLKNGKVLGLFKDENNCKKMLEFVGLRAKMYSFVLEDEEEDEGFLTKNKAKGVSKAITNSLEIKHYRDCLIKKQLIHRPMLVFRSKLHNLYTQEVNKLALSYNDTKRYICRDGVSTYAWGHYKIPTNEET